MGQKLSLKKFGDLIDISIAVDQRTTIEFEKEEISQIAYDSRNIVPNDGACLFFAIRGHSTDGHKFIDEVFRKNKHAIIVSENDLKKNYERSIQVKNINIAMASIAKNFFDQPDEQLKIVAITGTNGKTTSAYLCRAMLNKISKTGMISTIEYDTGQKKVDATNTTPMPIDLFSMLYEARKNSCRNVVMEASSHGLEQKRMYGLNVDVAIFTNLTQDHLDFHNDFEHYFLSKKKLFNGENGNFPKISIINIDDKYGAQLYGELHSKNMHVISFGVCEKADFRICNISKNDFSGSKFSIQTNGNIFNISSHLFGMHNMYNLTGSFAACMSLYNEPDKFISAINDFQNVPGRLEKIPIPNGATLFVDYAHTPEGLRIVALALKNIIQNTGKLITVFGCGGNRDRTKRPLMTKIANETSDIAIATSDNSRNEKIEDIFSDMKHGVADEKKIIFIPDRKEAIFYAIKISKQDDIILIAGKGHETYQIIGDKKYHFDDREVVKEICKI